MRVLHVFDHSLPLHSGYVYRSLAILHQQRQLGWETEQLTSTKHGDAVGGTADVEWIDAWRFFRTPKRSCLHRMPVLRQYAVILDLERRLRALVDEVGADLLHAHSPALNGIAALRVGRAAGIPVVYEVRGFWEDAAVSHGTALDNGLRYRLGRALETYVLRRADHCFCICEGLRQDIVARGIAPAGVTLIPNAVDTALFRPSTGIDKLLAARLGLLDKQVIGFIGSFYAYEGLELLLEAAAMLRGRRPRLRVLLVGGGMDERRLRDRAAALGVDDITCFAGRVSHAEVADYYGLIDVLAYPRRSMRITELVTPLKPLEAMAQQRLFVASDVGGHRELIEDGRTGLLHRAGDADDLAAKLDLLLHDQRLGAALRAAGRDYVEQSRNWPTSVARYAEPYAAVLAGRRRGSCAGG